MKQKLSLAQKIFKIKKAAKNIELGGRNESEGYAFARIGDVMDAVDGLLEKYRLMITGNVLDLSNVQESPVHHLVTPKGCITDVMVAWTVADIDSGEKDTWY